jgi:hypothetical protein
VQGHTYLDSEIQVPWQDGFELGQGIDALSGATKGCALEKFKTIPHTDGRYKSHSSIIHDLQEQHRDSLVNATATINLGSPAALGAKFGYASSGALSSSSFIIEYWIDGKYDFERATDHDLVLTSVAHKYVRDPVEFRKRYGDYFICGFQRRYNFHAIVKCK